MAAPIRVLFVDDEPRLRTCWGRLIGAQPDMSLVGCLSSADELLTRVPRDDSIVLLDLSMPGRDPLDAAAELRDARPECRVIVYSGHNDPDTLREVLSAGAWGLVDKLTPPLEILDAIRRVAVGRTVFPAGFVA
jgi:two-component system response regulator DesR